MDLGKVIEASGERGSSVPSQDVPFRDSPVPGLSSRNSGQTRFATTPTAVDQSHAVAEKPSPSSDVWAGAISRLQTQVSYNTSMLESHRRQVVDVEQAVGRLRGEMINVVQVLTELRGELKARPIIEQPPLQRHDPGDLDVLATQISNVTNKANEVDGLRMQVELLKNRIRRFEDRHSPRPMSGTRDGLDPVQGGYPHPPPPHPHSSLPPMRPSAMMSPREELKHPPHTQPMLASQGPPTLSTQHSTDSRASEPSSVQRGPPGFRPAEPLPPPPSISGWRPSADSRPPSDLPHPPPQYNPFRPQGMETETSAAGWAAVNSNQQVKRPLEEVQHHSPYGPLSTPGSPKRAKLAPIMPRGFGEDGIAPASSNGIQQMPDGALRPRSRATSNVSQGNRPHDPPVPAASQTGSYRFITSQIDGHDHWRSGLEGEALMQHPFSEGRGKGRGRGGRGGRGRGRGRGGHHPEAEHAPPPPHLHGGEHGALEHLHGVQTSPLGHHGQMRGGLVRRSGGAAGGPSDRANSHEDNPTTPGYGGDEDYEGGSGSKKSRTRPIRNAEGILIRKDGRPDMRSVSSANNLRKVHAKKEAERAEVEGRTPTSGRSLAPAQSEEDGMKSGAPASPVGDDEDDHEAQERHAQLMNKIFPRGIDGTGGLASSYFHQSEKPRSAPNVAMKPEPEEVEESDCAPLRVEDSNHASARQSQVRDVEMTDLVAAREEPAAPPEERARVEPSPGKSRDAEMARVEEAVRDTVAHSTEPTTNGQTAVAVA